MQEYQQAQSNGSRGLPGWFMAFLDGVGYSVEVFLRNDIGERRCRDLGGPLLLALAVLVFVTFASGVARQPDRFVSEQPAAADGEAPTRTASRRETRDPIRLPTLDEWRLLSTPLFCGVAISGHLRQRMRASRRRRQGAPPTHSYYTGRPKLLKDLRWLWPGVTELWCKRMGEPFLTCAGGIALLGLNPVLAFYLMLAGGVLCMTVTRQMYQERELVLDTADGLCDMLMHQDNIVAEYNPQREQPAAPRVVTAAPAPRRAPPPARPRGESAPAPKSQKPAAPAVPPALCQGLSENLMNLLQEDHNEE